MAASAITAGTIAAGAVQANSIATNAVTAGKVAADAIEAGNIAAGAVTAGKIAANAVEAATIASGAVTAAKINAGAVIATKLAANAVEADKIAANAVTAGKINAGAVTAGTIAAGAVQAGTIAAGAIQANDIAANAITTAKIAANAVTANEVLAGSITAVKIATDAVVAGKIAAGAVQADTIAANAITSAKIVAGSITSASLATDSVTSAKIAAGAVTADTIAANAITTGKIAAGAIGADQIAAQAIVASKLAVSDFTNLVPDSELQDVSAWAGIPNDGTGILVLRPIGNAQVKTTGDIAYLNDRNTVPRVDVIGQSGLIPVSSGDVLYLAGQMIRVTGTTMNARLAAQFLDKDKGGLGVVTIYGVNGTGNLGQVQSTEATVPVGAYYVRFFIQVYASGTNGNIIFGSPIVRFKNKGEMVVDGAITANKIMAGAIGTDALAAEAVVASKIAAGAIIASKIAANAIGAVHIRTDQAVITGTAQIGNAVVRSIHIGPNALYVPYMWNNTADRTVPVANNNANKILLFDRTVPDFEGGGYLVAFNAYFDGTANVDAFGMAVLMLDNTEVAKTKFGVRGVGGSAIQSMFPINLLGSANGTGTTRIRIYVWNASVNSDTIGNAPYVIRNIVVSLSGTRR